ncbi:MAG TPA: hypothetical protein VHT26_21615, partial [Trebonia sp.]|nr:hypothetical protein [Trebonia sp.]
MRGMGRHADPRPGRWAWFAGLALTAAATAAVVTIALRPSADNDHGATPRAPHRAAAPAQHAGASPSPASWQVTSSLSDLSLPLAGMPPVTDPANIYAAAGPNMLSPAVRGVPSRIYVPNSGGSTVTVIDPSTYRVIGSYQTGLNPQHVVPGYDMQTLYVTN